jgi:hypothetical protein
LQMVERWNGRAPLVVPVGVNNNGAALLMPMGAVDTPATP